MLVDEVFERPSLRSLSSNDQDGIRKVTGDEARKKILDPFAFLEAPQV